MNTGIHWKRVTLAGFLSELSVVLVLSAVILTYRFLIATGRTGAEYAEFAQNAGYYLATPVAAVATFGLSYGATQGLEADFISNGLVIGAIATLLAMPFFFGARPQDRKMYVVSFIIRIAAGWLGGFVAQRKG